MISCAIHLQVVTFFNNNMHRAAHANEMSTLDDISLRLLCRIALFFFLIFTICQQFNFSHTCIGNPTNAQRGFWELQLVIYFSYREAAVTQIQYYREYQSYNLLQHTFRRRVGECSTTTLSIKFETWSRSYYFHIASIISAPVETNRFVGLIY
jgi:hypothetical protein